ncbi:YpbB family protein [Lactobacillaceae bacterium Melli_B3]
MNRDLLMLLLSPTQPRRIRTIENVLLKNKTTSTLFGGMCYGILGFYGLGKNIDSTRTDQLLRKLIQANLVQVVEKQNQHQYLLTTAGTDWVHKQINHFEIPLTLQNNINYDLLRFRSQFLFAVQTVSEFSYQNANYSPMFNDIDAQQQIKRWFHRHKDAQLGDQFRDLLTTFLSQLPDSAAQFFASALNGHQITGLTETQRASTFRFDSSLGDVFDMVLFNRLITFLLTHRNRYPSGCQLVDSAKRSLISDSAATTYRDYLNYDHPNLDLIAAHRRLKVSTVKDHLYEVAMLLPLDNVQLTQFVSTQAIKILDSIYAGDVSDWSYDKDLLDSHHIDFFDYRMFQIFRGRLDEHG